MSRFSVLAVAFGLVALTGCSSLSAKPAATPEAAEPAPAEDVLDTMKRELAQSLTAPAEQRVGTTTLTSVELPADLPELPPMPLPEDRMSLSGLTTPAPAPAPSLVDISPTRE
jgi:hypothetical protein